MPIMQNVWNKHCFCMQIASVQRAAQQDFRKKNSGSLNKIFQLLL